MVTDVFGFIDVLIRCWDQMDKGQGHSLQRHDYGRKPVEFHLVSFAFLRRLAFVELQAIKQHFKLVFVRIIRQADSKFSGRHCYKHCLSHLL